MHSGYVYLGNYVFHSLLAVSNAEQERGLMYQKPPTPVMSFIYPYPKQNRFWMSNTPSKLDYRDWETDRKSTRLNSSHSAKSRMPSSA